MLLVSVLLLGGCAGVPSDPADREAYYETNDAIEPVNRAIFRFNQGLDAVILKPLATIYREILPRTLQDGIRNFLNNLRSPVLLANNLLQGDIDGAGETIARFTVNTIVGFGGFGDPAGDLGVEYRDEDFGQTLAVWGMGEGPYLMLPLFGPSNPRDVVGIVVDTLIDPINMWANNTDRDAIPVVRTVVRGIDRRARNIKTLEDLEKSSLDFYATIRSLYRQIRNDAIRNGDTGDSIPSPSISLDEDTILTGPRAQLIR
ncbi:MAG: VacJ family lipoprotein [Alphaproteobacteria bacterium]|nr:VacJ family lipoprotein [Alphaproteobacteria bacterium]